MSRCRSQDAECGSVLLVDSVKPQLRIAVSLPRQQRDYVEASVEKRPRNRKWDLRFDWSLTNTALLSNGFLFSGKYVPLQIVDDEDIEIMFNAFEQQNNVDIIELYVHKSSAGSSLGTAVDTGIISSDIVEVDDDDVVGESCGEETSDEENDVSIDGNSSDTDDNETRNMELLSVTNVEQGQHPPWTDAAHYTHINWLHPDEEDILGEDLHESWNVGDALYKGLQFDTKEDLKNALIQYSMRTHQTYHVVESKSSKYIIKCPNHKDGCPFYMRAILSRKTVNWTESMESKTKSNLRVYGVWDESFATLPTFLKFIESKSPGFFYQICHDDLVVGNRGYRQYQQFERVFWTFKQCADAFNYCKPLIQVDGTHLYGKYRGTLLIATTQDGNSNVLPLAFVVVESENSSSWSWFLSHIRLHVTQKQGICLISDRHAGIKSAVQNEALG
ncbi:hypothetical protein VNO78_27918 [Psophocarpus tetragonolobus]|uniref:MULE transposase domain-containing protein n=1 Tax=Psophocarpus tetragonolobus TaxID=3891 RepID=A0AAN9S1L7_PSOTE